MVEVCVLIRLNSREDNQRTRRIWSFCLQVGWHLPSCRLMIKPTSLGTMFSVWLNNCALATTLPSDFLRRSLHQHGCNLFILISSLTPAALKPELTHITPRLFYLITKGRTLLLCFNVCKCQTWILLIRSRDSPAVFEETEPKHTYYK